MCDEKERKKKKQIYVVESKVIANFARFAILIKYDNNLEQRILSQHFKWFKPNSPTEMNIYFSHRKK